MDGHEAADGNGQVVSRTARRESTVGSTNRFPAPVEVAWNKCKDGHRELLSYTFSVDKKVGELLKVYKQDFAKVIPEAVAGAEADLLELRQKCALAQEATRFGIRPGDPDYERVRTLDDRLAYCTERTAQLHQMCQAYCEELVFCRARAQQLRARRGALARTAKRAMARNALIASAAEPMVVRALVGGETRLDWLTELLPLPSSSSGSRACSAAARPRWRGGTAKPTPRSGVGSIRCESAPHTAKRASQCSTRIGTDGSALQRPETSPSEWGCWAAPPGSAPAPTTLLPAPPLSARSNASGAARRSSGSAIRALSARGTTSLAARSSFLVAPQEGGEATISASSSKLGVTQPLRLPPCSARSSLGGPAPPPSEAEERYLKEISRLELRLNEERRLNRELSAANAAETTRKGRLEEFFLLCMHDFKQGAARRKCVDNALHASQAFPSDAHGLVAAQAGHGESSQSVDPGIFLQLMAQSDEVHMLLYEKMFAHRQAYFKSYDRVAPHSLRGSTVKHSNATGRMVSEATWDQTAELDLADATLDDLVAMTSPSGASGRMVSVC